MNQNNKRNKFHSLNISLKTSLKKISPDKNLISQKSTIAVNTKNEEFIKRLVKDNKNLEKQLYDEKKRVKELESKLKTLENEKAQLIIVLKLVESTGIDIEAIVDEWNKEVQNQAQEQIHSNSSSSAILRNKQNKNKHGNKNVNHSFNNTLSIENNNNSVLNSSNFLPLNLDEPNSKRKINNNHTYSNIPKLNFDKIKMSQPKCVYNITAAEEMQNNNNKEYFSHEQNKEQALLKERNKRKFNNLSSCGNNNQNSLTHITTKKNKKDKHSSSVQCINNHDV